MRIELREVINESCHTHCTKEQRLSFTDQDICKQSVSALDGLPVRCVGNWAYEKIYFLQRYFEQFAVGMHLKWRGHIAYFEIASGPGRCILRGDGTEIDGTALAIVRSKGFQYIEHAVFMDINEDVVNTLNKRIHELDGSGKATAMIANYKEGEVLSSLIRKINPNGLNLIFIDPTDCSVPFSTIKTLKASGLKFDLILNVATYSDFNRNIRQAIENPESNVRRKYETFLGSQDFFSNTKVLSALEGNNHQDIRLEFLDFFYKQLHSIGLKHTDAVHIHHLYHLVFASAATRGLDFWTKAVKSIGPDSQRELTF